MREAFPDHNFLEQALPRTVNRRCTEFLKSPVAYLLGFRQVLGGACPEFLYTNRIPIVATFPNVCKLAGSERDVSLLRDAVREYARIREDRP